MHYEIKSDDYEQALKLLKQVQPHWTNKGTLRQAISLLQNAKLAVDRTVDVNLGKTAQGADREVLSADKIKQLFGKRADKIVWFDFDKKRYSVELFQGLAESSFARVLNEAEKVKKFVNEQLAYMNLEVVASVVTSVPDKNFHGVGKPILIRKNTSVGSGGRIAVAGTIVCRDIATGNILPVPEKWVGVSPNCQRHMCADADTLESGARIWLRSLLLGEGAPFYSEYAKSR